MRILKSLKLIIYVFAIISLLTSNSKSTEECFEGASRAIFKFNLAIDDIILEPIAKGYSKLPDPIKTGTVRAQAAVSPAASVDGVVTTVHYRGAFHAMATVAKAEGVTALWRGYGLMLGRSIFGTICLIGYDMLPK